MPRTTLLYPSHSWCTVAVGVEGQSASEICFAENSVEYMSFAICSRSSYRREPVFATSTGPANSCAATRPCRPWNCWISRSTRPCRANHHVDNHDPVASGPRDLWRSRHRRLRSGHVDRRFHLHLFGYLHFDPDADLSRGAEPCGRDRASAAGPSRPGRVAGP